MWDVAGTFFAPKRLFQELEIDPDIIARGVDAMLLFYQVILAAPRWLAPFSVSPGNSVA